MGSLVRTHVFEHLPRALLCSVDKRLKYLSPQDIGKETFITYNVISDLMEK